MPLDKTLVIAPHPDDELLGCGGTLLRRKDEGVELGWMIVTSISEQTGWSSKKVKQRENEISKVRKGLDVDKFYNLRLPTTKLDTIPTVDLIQRFGKIFKDFEPSEVLIPHRGDSHSDHRIVFNAASACCKWFRYPSVKRVLAYETLSETEFSLDPTQTFQPNVFVDITPYFEKKMELLRVYASEMGDFPFPRSETSIKALAQLCGCNSGFHYAERFELLLERG